MKSRVKKYYRQPNYFALPEMFAFHALGKSPVITDGDIKSGAIITFIYLYSVYFPGLSRWIIGYIVEKHIWER